MAKVTFTTALKRFYPDLDTLHISGSSVAEIVEGLDQKHPGLRDYLVDESGNLRQHVNIFIGNELIRDKEHLRDKVRIEDDIYIMQALSGG